MAEARDNFPNKVKVALAHRAGHRCSHPECQKLTSGPSSVEDEFVNTGNAAHIIAAAPNGPRADASISKAERKSINNGIWLCRIHAYQVDNDVPGHDVATLRKWKKEAEERARVDAFTNRTSPAKVIFELDDDDKEFFRSLALPAEESTDVTMAKMALASHDNIETYLSDRNWPEHVISLNLTAIEDSTETAVTLEGLAQGIHTTEAINIIAPPGTGKTTTLIKLAENILATGSAVAAYISLGEWADRPESWFNFLRRKHAFRLFKDEHFRQLAYEGRLVLVLDGWIELNPEARRRAINDLKAIKRDFPMIGIVIGTRQQELPINGAIVKIEGLSDVQQIELAQQIKGEEGAAFVDQAWRTPGLRELITIPLYLTALLATAPGATFPKTKDEVLSHFVNEHENEAGKAEILRSELFGCHKELLAALGVAANKAGGTNIPGDVARTAISHALKALENKGQLAPGIQPAKVLDVLVDTHLLVRASANSGVLFQHQQFQEWYASFEVERLMLDAARGSPEALKALRDEVINWPAWEESILFACERLSLADDAGRGAVAAAILEAMGIDPMLAAELIFRAAPEVWQRVSSEVVAFAKRWHKPGKADRAARFMIISGRPEFSEEIWSLLSLEDDQVILKTLRLAPRFRHSVLGPDAEKRLAGLPGKFRSLVVAEIGMSGGYDGIELSARHAKQEADAESVLNIISALSFRRATRHVTDIVTTAAKSVLQLIARKGYPEEIEDKDANALILEMRRQLARDETDPVTAVGYLNLGWEEEEKTALRLKSLLESKDFPIKNEHARGVIGQAAKKYPRVVAEAILQRAVNGLDTFYDAHQLVENLDAIDDGPVATTALKGAASDRAAPVINAVIGPATVGKLIDEYIRMDSEWRANGQQLGDMARKEYHRVKDAITTSRQSSFIPALLERARTDQPMHITALAELLARHGKETESKPLVLHEETERHLVTAIDHWIDVLLPSAEATRHQLSVVAEAIQRVPHSQFTAKLQKMLERDLADWARARKEYCDSGRGKAMTPDVTHSYTLQYRRTFSAIGDETVVARMKELLPDQGFGFDAACVLFDIWNRDHPSGKDKRFGSWHDYSDAKAKRARLMDTEYEPPTSDFSETIFAVIQDLAKPEKSKESHHHAFRLAKIALGMPYGRKAVEIAALFALPQTYAAKLDVLTVAAIAGETLSADMLLAGFYELLETGKKEPWRLEESNGELMNWVELFAFSDRPAAVLEILGRLPEEYRWPHHLRRLLTALRDSPHPDAMKVLQAIAAQKPELTEEDEWLAAIVDQKSQEAGQLLLKLVCDGTLKLSRVTRGMGISRQLIGYAAHYPDIRAEMMKRYEKLADGPAKAMLESALIELPDEPFILMLIDSMARAKRADDGRLSRAIKKLALGHRPVEGWPGAFEQFSVSLAEFRRKLFAIVMLNDARSELAATCLYRIERLRDEYGRINEEPRHPDIASGKRAIAT